MQLSGADNVTLASPGYPEGVSPSVAGAGEPPPRNAGQDASVTRGASLRPLRSLRFHPEPPVSDALRAAPFRRFKKFRRRTLGQRGRFPHEPASRSVALSSYGGLCRSLTSFYRRLRFGCADVVQGPGGILSRALIFVPERFNQRLNSRFQRRFVFDF